MTMSVDQLTAEFCAAFDSAGSADLDLLGDIRYAERHALAVAAARAHLCILARNPRTAPVCVVCGDQWCFNHCPYCAVDTDAPDPAHARFCPFSLRQWLVCPDERCTECDAPFDDGYCTTIEQGGNNLQVCVPCALALTQTP